MAFVVRLLATRPAAALCRRGIHVVLSSPRPACAPSTSPCPSSRPCRRTASRGAPPTRPRRLPARHRRADRAPARAARHRRAPGRARRLAAPVAGAPGVAAVLGPAQAVGDPRRFVVSRRGAARFVVLLATSRPARARSPPSGGWRTGCRSWSAPPGCRAGTRVLRRRDRSRAGDGRLARRRPVARRVVTAVVMFVLLAIMMRALVAPVLLLAGSALACAASFGLTALLAPTAADLVYYVPLVGGVMLVGLGSDYNVFIAGRIREEMRTAAAARGDRGRRARGLPRDHRRRHHARVDVRAARPRAAAAVPRARAADGARRPARRAVRPPAADPGADRARRPRDLVAEPSAPGRVGARLLRGGGARAGQDRPTQPTSATRRSPHWPSGSRRARPTSSPTSFPTSSATPSRSRARPAAPADEFVARVGDRARVGTRAAEHDAPVVISVLASMLAPARSNIYAPHCPATTPGCSAMRPHGNGVPRSRRAGSRDVRPAAAGTRRG